MIGMTPISYGGFYDVPRYITFQYRGNKFSLESPFDEELDDYTESYTVYTVDGTDGLDAKKTSLGTVPVKDVTFDPTRRKFIDASVVDKFIEQAL